MLKLLFIPTGKIFTLPDEDVMKITKNDRAGNYKILDAGYIETKEETVAPETVEKLVLQTEEKAQEIEAKDKEKEAKENKVKPKTQEVEPKSNLDLKKMKVKELVHLCRRVGVKGNITESKATLLKRLEEKGFNIQ